MASDEANARERDAGQSAETVLENERAQFDLAERAARFGYWRLRLADNHVTWSPGMYRLLGVDQSVKADNDWLLEQVDDDDAAQVRELVTAAIKARSPFQYRTQSKYASATAQIVETQGEVEVGPDDRVVSLIGVCHDVTAQVSAETARAKAEQMYRVMAEQASDIIILYGDAGKILFASDALERILKRTVAEIDQSEYLKLIHPDDKTAAQPLATWPVDGSTTVATYRIMHGDGHYVWIETTTRAVYANGKFQNGISVARDVSERKAQELEMQEARRRAETANKAKSGFLANMSHELRTPLNAIIGFSDIMREELFGKLGDKRYTEYAGLIGESGKLLLDLITDILDMAKIEAGKMELHIDRVDLRGAIDDCVRLLQPRTRSTGIEIATDIQAGDADFFADRRAIKQILLNLLSNAVKFSLPGGKVLVETRLSGDRRLALSVKDEGIGIPSDQLPRLGKPFEQVCVDPMLAKGGTGLGLALVQALAQQHGGEMHIESEVGAGTKVTVELPLHPEAVAA